MIHIFDIDYTVLKKASALCFLREALRSGVIRYAQVRRLPFEWLRYKLGRPNQDFIEDAVTHLAGLDETILMQTAANSFERYMKPSIYLDAIQRIRQAQNQGEQVLYATSSLQLIIQPLERFLGIESSIATALEWHEGKTTGKIAGNSAFGIRKKTAVEAWLAEHNADPRDVCFYSDSYTDLPLLEICGKPIAVNPDRFLLREATKRSWEILRFSRVLGKE